jgi:predicted protein tyrosine phosphatase
MPWIENIPLENVAKAQHHDCGINSMLIQISDHDMAFPVPKHTFKEVHQFTFLDIEEDGMTNTGDGKTIDLSEFAITDEQAQQLVALLQHAFENRMNVVVHCHAGICRSGAVCEVGVMMGFSDCERFRAPNLLVKHKMMRVLGWTYDSEEKSYDVLGTVNEWGFITPKNPVD